MKKLEILNAKVGHKNGMLGLVIPDDAKQAYDNMLDYCKERKGGYVSLILHPPRKPRTTGEKSQNHAINGFCQQIAVSTGQPFDDVKKHCKQVAVGMGYPIQKDKNGFAVKDFWGNTNGVSETEIDTQEAGTLIDAIKLVAAELNIKLKESKEI